jgi:hypothetical protein
MRISEDYEASLVGDEGASPNLELCDTTNNKLLCERTNYSDTKIGHELDMRNNNLGRLFCKRNCIEYGQK